MTVGEKPSMEKPGLTDDRQQSAKFKKLIELGERNGRLTYDDVNRMITTNP